MVHARVIAAATDLEAARAAFAELNAALFFLAAADPVLQEGWHVFRWIRDLRVDQTGQQVRKGQVLFTLYSPELYAAQQELLALRDRDPDLAAAARDRLRLWGLSAGQVADIETRGLPLEDVPMLAPASGWVLEKMAVAGMRAMAGERLYRIASLDPVWVEAEVYEDDLPWLSLGQTATVTLPHVPGGSFSGTVTFLHPVLDPVTRTRRARVELANPELALLPDMVADVTLRSDQGEALQVPQEAVIFTGPRRIVFVDEGEDRLAPREVKLGRKGTSTYEVLSGLSAGDQVVASRNFLVAAESRIRSATGTWGSSGHQH